MTEHHAVIERDDLGWTFDPEWYERAIEQQAEADYRLTRQRRRARQHLELRAILAAMVLSGVIVFLLVSQ